MTAARLKQLSHRLTRRLRTIPKRTYIIVGFCVVAILYGGFFIVPRSVQFSYAAPSTCIGQLTLLPGLQKPLKEKAFAVSTEGGFSIGNVKIASTRTCFAPITEPKEGTTMVATAPFGFILLLHGYRVHVPAAPVASADAFKKPVPATKPLTVALSSADVVYRYSVLVDKKEVACKPMGSAVTCDMPALKLVPGTSHKAALVQSFKAAKKTRLTTTLTTLNATAITGGSVHSGETVFARPTEFSFTTDKLLKSARATLRLQSGDKPTTITAKVTTKDKTITVTLDKELERDKDYVLTVSDVEATDGSGLIEPYKVPFHMSGGPKVTGVSIGSYGISTVAQVVVTFDQELSGEQDVGKIVTFAGGSAAISRSGNQIVYQLQNLPLCTPFQLTVTKELQSKYDIPSTDDWSYASRTICHSTSVYGHSVKGRALIAYYFGTSGSVTMYAGSIHGNESSAAGLMNAWVDYLEADPTLYSGRRIVIVPSINPDGVAANTRTNANGVNLSRNFPTSGWVSDINDTDGVHKGGGGSAPLSEPESAAIAQLTQQVHPRLLLSFHAAGSIVIGDPGGYSAGYATRYASLAGYGDATYATGTFDYDITGAYEQWTHDNIGIPSIVVELGAYQYYSFSNHRSALTAMLE